MNNIRFRIYSIITVLIIFNICIIFNLRLIQNGQSNVPFQIIIATLIALIMVIIGSGPEIKLTDIIRMAIYLIVLFLVTTELFQLSFDIFDGGSIQIVILSYSLNIISIIIIFITTAIIYNKYNKTQKNRVSIYLYGCLATILSLLILLYIYKQNDIEERLYHKYTGIITIRAISEKDIRICDRINKLSYPKHIREITISENNVNLQRVNSISCRLAVKAVKLHKIDICSRNNIGIDYVEHKLTQQQCINYYSIYNRREEIPITDIYKLNIGIIRAKIVDEDTCDMYLSTFDEVLTKDDNSKYYYIDNKLSTSTGLDQAAGTFLEKECIETRRSRIYGDICTKMKIYFLGMNNIGTIIWNSNKGNEFPCLYNGYNNGRIKINLTCLIPLYRMEENGNIYDDNYGIMYYIPMSETYCSNIDWKKRQIKLNNMRNQINTNK